MIRRYILAIIFLISTVMITQTYAVVYPTATPTGEITGGAFQTYFNNMFASGTAYGDCLATLQVVAGFDNITGAPICVTPTAAGFSLLGQTAGDTVRFDGTDWIRTNFLYNNGANIGIGTITPTATLDVNGQIRIRGGSPAAGRILMSDATGIATWYDPLPSLSGSFWAIGGNSVTSIQNLGTTTNYSLPFITNNIERMRILTNGNIGIGVTNPTAMLEIAGQIKINGGIPGAGKVLTSDATGLASWVTPTVATASETLALSGSLVGTPNYVAKYTPTGTGINNSQIYDNGTNIGIGTITPGAKFDIVGGDMLVNGITVGRGGGAIATNTVLGYQSLYNGVTGYQNTAIGMSSLYNNTIGYNNTALGYLAGSNMTIGSNNIAIGYNAQVLSNTSDNQLNIGGWIYGSNGDIGIGISNPGAKLEVAGQIKITGGSAGSGKILVSDATGLASWQSSVPASSVNASNITGGIPNYITKFGSGGVGIFQSLLYETGARIGLGNTNPGYTLDVTGTGNFIGFRLPTGAGLGKVLVSDATGGATWSTGFSGSVTASGITGGSGYYIPYFGAGGNGLLSSFLYYTGSRLGINTTNPGYMVDIQGSGSILNAGSGLCINDTCINSWTGLNNIVKSTGTPNYIAKFDTSGVINNSQLYETGGKLYIGDIPAILGGAATIGYITVESLGSTNSSNPLLTLSENGGQECRMWINGANKMGSNCEWTAGTSGFGFLPNQIPRADATGDSLTGGTLYNVGNNVGIGTSSPSTTLDVIGGARITGDLTVQGKVITDTLVNRTVNNVSISGSILPDVAAPLVYRDIGALGQRWNNLYLSGQISIGGGSPGAGKILTSDATGLATWSSVFSGTTTASGIIGGTQGYITKFGTGGNGIVNSLFYETGSYVALGSTTPTSRFEIWTGATTMFHTRGTNNLGIGSAAVRYQTTGSANVGIGPNALRTLTTGYSNAAIGEGALYGNTQGYFNAAIGAQALYSNNIGNWNVAMGNQALWTNLDGNYNVALGGQALYSNSANDSNIAIGYQALRATVADNNIGIGYSAGSGITSGTNNIIIGTNAQAQSNTASNQLNIGGWIYGTNGNIGLGDASPSTRLEIDSGIANDSGLKFTRLTSVSPVVSNGIISIGVDSTGKVVGVSPVSNIAVYTGTLRSSPPTPNPNLNTFEVSYDFNQYFGIPGKQSFVVSKGDGPSNNGPYFKENGTDALCSITGTYGGPSDYDCADPDPATGLSASPYNSFTMSAKGDTFGYQLALGARGDAPLFARSGRFNGSQTGGLYTNDSPYQTPAPWQRVLSLPANHPEYLYINTGLNSQLQAQSGGGRVGIGTTTPTSRFEVWTGSTTDTLLHFRGSQNIGLGLAGLSSAVSGSRNTGIGASALDILSSGNGNTALGYSAGSNLTTGSSNIMIGSGALAQSATASNQLNIGNWIYGVGGNIGIGVSNPSARLEINGQIEITGGTPGVGKVLTSDANGLATWETPSGGGGGVGVCTIASVTISNSAVARTCTGMPASTAVAVTCTPNGAFSTPNTTAINCRANGTADSVTCNTTAANTNARTYTCMWAQ